jgi:hypothetical protein
LGHFMFFGVSGYTKTVTVKVPRDATGYGQVPATYSNSSAGNNTTVTWGNGFRGGGWTGSAFTDEEYHLDININLTLNIVYDD